ncbi:MAG TPA: VOC family protein [Rhizomicrobium sp.]|jgi:catechol 2,3-dioxygenase-like lactoylglutathione lyase family enzyme|nr:VOC family protein [Rhizomicrobium sp.]
MTFRLAIVFAVMLGILPRIEAMAADTPDASSGHITGIGGIFIKSKDPKALSAWYRDVLGMPMESWGGAALRYDAPGHPPVATWNAFAQNTKYMAPSTREFMLDFAVDDMDAIIAKLTAKGVPILKRDDSDPSGKFAWIMDPDGTKIELWQPPH